MAHQREAKNGLAITYQKRLPDFGPPRTMVTLLRNMTISHRYAARRSPFPCPKRPLPLATVPMA